jgi:hypothetical protein
MILFDYYLQVELQDVLTIGEQLWRKGDQPAVVPVQDLTTADLAALLKNSHFIYQIPVKHS